MQVNSIQNQYTNTSFTSTYRIPLVGPHIKSGKREALKKLASKYQNYKYPNGNNGAVRVSVSEELDEIFENELKNLKLKVYQKFSQHDVPANKMDQYIKECLDSRNYEPHGEQKRKKRR